MTRFFLGLLSAGAFALTASAQVKAPVEPLNGVSIPAAPAAAATPAAPAAPCCEPAATCCPRFYGGAEWLYMTVQGNPLPALVTSNPNGTTIRGVQEGFRNSTTFILAGGNRANNDYRNGIRATVGYWLDDCQKTGIELSYFFLENSREGSTFTSDTTPIISRPVVQDGVPGASILAFSNSPQSSIAVTSANEFEGAAALLRRNISCCGNRWVDVIAGYRYLNMADELSIVQNRALNFQGFGTFTEQSGDFFNTRNIFNGGVIGLAAGRNLGRFSVDGRASVGLGNLHRSASIAGYTSLSTGGAPNVITGGFLTGPTNIGNYSDDVFAVVPEASVRFSWAATSHLRLNVGFNWLMMNNVLRAGDQVDLNFQSGINGTQPAFLNRDTTVYAYGASAGVEFRY